MEHVSSLNLSTQGEIKTGFESVAEEIVRNSIRSAVCVDNAFVEPYSDRTDGDDYETPQLLFESFRKEKCNLDIYRYIDSEKWEKDKYHVLKNHDLLILDWELVGDPPFRDSLKILWEAVELSSLSFVLIYTQQPDLSLIELNIRSNFGKSFENRKVRKDQYEEFCNELEEKTDIDDSDELFESVSSDCKDLILARGDRKPIIKKLIRRIKEHLGPGEFKSFMAAFINAGKKFLGTQEVEEIFEFIGFYLGNTMINKNGKSRRVSPIEDEERSFVVNNTTISIFVKEKTATPEGEYVISPNNVYRKFAEIFYRRPRNFMALLSLEMKNLYLENSSIIGKELFDIDEDAFFHHQKNLDSEDDFYNFLMNCWKDQFSAFYLPRNPKLFSVLEEYKNSSGYSGEIPVNEEDLTRLRENLAKLNYYYSFLQTDRKEGDKIRFGDVFSLSNNEDGTEFKGFALCVTPHCDCLHPENIKDTFYFVYGSKTELKEGLQSAEDGFYSFLFLDKKPICIRWKMKPSTLHISTPLNKISLSIKVKHRESDNYMIYKATQKENYTQRIANEAFSKASRVGIELAGLKVESRDDEKQS